MTSTASMTTQYFEYQKDLEIRYGKHSVVFWMCGSFYEIYGLSPGKDKVCSTVQSMGLKAIDCQIGNLDDISKILSIQMTKRSKERQLSIDNPYMCGFPAVALSKHLAKLLQYQYTVAIYDQFDSEDPRREKERRLQKIYSPSTYISDDQDANNILLCCTFESYCCPITKTSRLYAAASHIDLATGHSGCHEFYDDEDHPNQVIQEIYKLIYCVDPSEIIIIDQSGDGSAKQHDQTKGQEIIHSMMDDFTTQMVHTLPKQTKFYDPTYQEAFLKKIFMSQAVPKREMNREISWYDHIGFSTPDIAASFIQLLQFIYEHDEHIVDRIAVPSINKSTKNLYLNQDALYHLNLLPSVTGSPTPSRNSIHNSKPTSCFSIMNRVKTKMGERLLKSRISRPITDIDELNQRYDMIDKAKPHHRIYSDALKSIVDIDKKYRQTVLGRSRPYEFNELYCSFAKCLEIFEANANLFEIPADRFVLIKKMNKFITNNFNIERIGNVRDCKLHYFNKGVFPELDKIYDRIAEITNIFNQFETAINQFGSDNAIRASIKFLGTTQYGKTALLGTTKRAYECIKKLNQIDEPWTYKITYSNSPKPLIFKLSDMTVESTVNQHVRLRSPLLEKFATILEKDKAAAEAEASRLFGSLMKKFTNQYNDIVMWVSSKIASIDVAVSSAIVSIENYYNRPKLINMARGEFHMIGLRHPIIEKIADDSEYVTNNLELNSKTIGILLYGLNSSGKSSLLRAIGINIVMAQAGLYCSCDAITLSCYESLFTKISSNDNLFKGQSTFVAEMCCLKDMLQQSTPKSLILCDELTAGTETNSATGIVAASIITFIQKETNFIFTTHLHGLMDFPEIVNNKKLNIFHFKVTTKDSQIIQDRKLIEGSGESQYGIEIAHAIGLSKQFISKAYDFRRNFQGIDNQILSNKRSRYNAKVIVDSCTECGTKPTKGSQYLHVHHQHHQADANSDGKINGKSFHKNIKHNLTVLCERCHQQHHNCHDE